MYKSLAKRIVKKILNKNLSWKDKLLREGAIIENEGIIRLPNGILMNFTKELEYILYEIYVEKEYMFFSNKDSVFVDIGMNVASTTLYFGCKDNIKKVYSFEPFPYTFKAAESNIKLNPNVEKKTNIFNYGLSNQEKLLNIPYCRQETGCMSINNSNERLDKILPDNCEIENVSIVVKDAGSVLAPILYKHNREQIVVKIDTEGSEYDIFESLERSDLLGLIDVFLIEFHNGYKKLEDILLRNNFVLFYKDNIRKEPVGMIYAVKAAN